MSRLYGGPGGRRFHELPGEHRADTEVQGRVGLLCTADVRRWTSQEEQTDHGSTTGLLRSEGLRSDPLQREAEQIPVGSTDDLPVCAEGSRGCGLYKADKEDLERWLKTICRI